MDEYWLVVVMGFYDFCPLLLFSSPVIYNDAHIINHPSFLWCVTFALACAYWPCRHAACRSLSTNHTYRAVSDLSADACARDEQPAAVGLSSAVRTLVCVLTTALVPPKGSTEREEENNKARPLYSGGRLDDWDHSDIYERGRSALLLRIWQVAIGPWRSSRVLTLYYEVYVQVPLYGVRSITT